MMWRTQAPILSSMETLMNEYCKAVDENVAAIREAHEELDALLTSARVSNRIMDSQ